MNQKKRVIILERLQKKNPYPKISLNYTSTFELLISTLLSAQTTDTGVNYVTTQLYRVANTPHAMLRLKFEGIKFFIKKIGLFNTKAKNIIEICRILIEKYNGLVPEDRQALESLPGIGRKSANIILNTAYGWPTIAVDTHVFRLCNRTKFAIGKNVKEVEKKLIKVVPLKFKKNCHQLFIHHGRNICMSRNPNCKFCVISDLCEYAKKTDFT